MVHITIKNIGTFSINIYIFLASCNLDKILNENEAISVKKILIQKKARSFSLDKNIPE